MSLIINETSFEAERYYETGNLCLLVPGMLFDNSNPPSKSILHNIKNELKFDYAFLEYERVAQVAELEFLELPISEQLHNISELIKSIEVEREINKLSVISHSVGSLVVASLLLSRDCISDEAKIHQLILLSPMPD